MTLVLRFLPPQFPGPLALLFICSLYTFPILYTFSETCDRLLPASSSSKYNRIYWATKSSNKGLRGFPGLLGHLEMWT